MKKMRTIHLHKSYRIEVEIMTFHFIILICLISSYSFTIGFLKIKWSLKNCSNLRLKAQENKCSKLRLTQEYFKPEMRIQTLRFRPVVVLHTRVYYKAIQKDGCMSNSDQEEKWPSRKMILCSSHLLYCTPEKSSATCWLYQNLEAETHCNSVSL